MAEHYLSWEELVEEDGQGGAPEAEARSRLAARPSATRLAPVLPEGALSPGVAQALAEKGALELQLRRLVGDAPPRSGQAPPRDLLSGLRADA